MNFTSSRKILLHCTTKKLDVLLLCSYTTHIFLHNLLRCCRTRRKIFITIVARSVIEVGLSFPSFYWSFYLSLPLYNSKMWPVVLPLESRFPSIVTVTHLERYVVTYCCIRAFTLASRFLFATILALKILYDFYLLFEIFLF